MSDGPYPTFSSAIAELPKGGDVRSLASRLSLHIQRIEKSLNSYAGRCKVEVAEQPTDNMLFLKLRTRRDKDEWVFEYKEEVKARPSDVVVSALQGMFVDANWHPLKQASIEIKLRAVSLLPALFAAMEGHNERLRSRIIAALGVLENLDRTVNVKQEGN